MRSLLASKALKPLLLLSILLLLLCCSSTLDCSSSGAATAPWAWTGDGKWDARRTCSTRTKTSIGNWDLIKLLLLLGFRELPRWFLPALSSVAQMSWWRNNILHADPRLCFWSCPNSACSFFDPDLLEWRRRRSPIELRSNRTCDKISWTSAAAFKHVVGGDLRLLPCLIHHEVGN